MAKIEEHISGGMVRRTEYVLAKETANPRQKNKNFGYVNRYAA